MKGRRGSGGFIHNMENLLERRRSWWEYWAYNPKEYRVLFLFRQQLARKGASQKGATTHDETDV